VKKRYFGFINGQLMWPQIYKKKTTTKNTHWVLYFYLKGTHLHKEMFFKVQSRQLMFKHIITYKSRIRLSSLRSSAYPFIYMTWMPHLMKNKNVKKRLIKFWKPELTFLLKKMNVNYTSRKYMIFSFKQMSTFIDHNDTFYIKERKILAKTTN
jgi:hypothetical protein